VKSLSPLNQKSIFKYNFEIKEGATEKVRKTLFHPKSEEHLLKTFSAALNITNNLRPVL